VSLVKVGLISEFGERRFKTISLMGKRVAVFREPDGAFRAIEFSCKHQGADLSSGRIVGDEVTCPRHGWRYDLRSGDCLSHNAPSLRRHAVEIRGDEIHVALTPDPPARPDIDWDALQ
jgi:phenylpropionate dioxygenase-like ring-hydroxylating dioxygenase large terminal subunit